MVEKLVVRSTMVPSLTSPLLSFCIADIIGILRRTLVFACLACSFNAAFSSSSFSNASYTFGEVKSLSIVRCSGPASFKNLIKSGGISCMVVSGGEVVSSSTNTCC